MTPTEFAKLNFPVLKRVFRNSKTGKESIMVLIKNQTTQQYGGWLLSVDECQKRFGYLRVALLRIEGPDGEDLTPRFVRYVQMVILTIMRMLGRVNP